MCTCAPVVVLCFVDVVCGTWLVVGRSTAVDVSVFGTVGDVEIRMKMNEYAGGELDESG